MVTVSFSCFEGQYKEIADKEYRSGYESFVLAYRHVPVCFSITVYFGTLVYWYIGMPRRIHVTLKLNNFLIRKNEF